MRTKFAFALAEVLIVIGIIYIIMAMVIPPLAMKYRSTMFKTKFKKAVSVLSQAALKNEAEYGFNYAGVGGHWGGEETDPEIKEILLKNIADLNEADYKYITFSDKSTELLKGKDYYTVKQSTEVKADFAGDDLYGVYVLPDGTNVILPSDLYAGLCHQNTVNFADWWYDGADAYTCGGYIDVNGPKPPNEEVSCTKGTTSYNLNEPCTVDDNQIGDVFPIVFHDNMVEPATNAARAVFLK